MRHQRFSSVPQGPLSAATSALSFAYPGIILQDTIIMSCPLVLLLHALSALWNSSNGKKRWGQALAKHFAEFSFPPLLPSPSCSHAIWVYLYSLLVAGFLTSSYLSHPSPLGQGTSWDYSTGEPQHQGGRRAQETCEYCIITDLPSKSQVKCFFPSVPVGVSVDDLLFVCSSVPPELFWAL